MGGTSAFNGMLYTRGSRADYDTWRDMGHPEWSSEKLLPYFQKSETSLTHRDGKSFFRGEEGPSIVHLSNYDMTQIRIK